jgi:hypothetical protein
MVTGSSSVNPNSVCASPPLLSDEGDRSSFWNIFYNARGWVEPETE